MSIEGPGSSREPESHPRSDEYLISKEFGVLPCHTTDEAREDLAPHLDSICRLRGRVTDLTVEELPKAFRCDRSVLPLFGTSHKDRRYLQSVTLEGHAIETYEDRRFYLFLSEVRTFSDGRAAVPLALVNPQFSKWTFPKLELFEAPAAIFGELPLSDDGPCVLRPAFSSGARDEAYEHAIKLQDEISEARMRGQIAWMTEFNHASLLIALLVNEVEKRHLEKDKGLQVIASDGLKERVASQTPGLILGLSHLTVRHGLNEVGIVTFMPGEAIQEIAKDEVAKIKAVNEFPLLEKIYSLRIESEGMLLEGIKAEAVQLRPIKAA